MTRPTEPAVDAEARVDALISQLLRGGVLLASIVAVAGGIGLLLLRGSQPVNFRAFNDAPSPLRSLDGIAHQALQLDSRAIVQLGLVLLIGTPIARVALTLIAFALQRDRLYVAMTALVLALLLYGIIWGAA